MELTNTDFALSAAAKLAAESSLDAHQEFVGATVALNFITMMHNDEMLDIEGFPDTISEADETYFTREYHRAAEELSRERGLIH